MLPILIQSHKEIRMFCSNRLSIKGNTIISSWNERIHENSFLSFPHMSKANCDRRCYTMKFRSIKAKIFNFSDLTVTVILERNLKLLTYSRKLYRTLLLLQYGEFLKPTFWQKRLQKDRTDVKKISSTDPPDDQS